MIIHDLKFISFECCSVRYQKAYSQSKSYFRAISCYELSQFT